MALQPWAPATACTTCKTSSSHTCLVLWEPLYALKAEAEVAKKNSLLCCDKWSNLTCPGEGLGSSIESALIIWEEKRFILWEVGSGFEEQWGTWVILVRSSLNCFNVRDLSVPPSLTLSGMTFVAPSPTVYQLSCFFHFGHTKIASGCTRLLNQTSF